MAPPYIIHLQNPSDDEEPRGKIDTLNSKGKMIKCKRAWPRQIYILQKEDSQGYGFTFRPAPIIQTRERTTSSMMTYALCTILSNSKELWEAVDCKESVWRHDRWEGYVMSFVKNNCFRFLNIRSDKTSPFKGGSNNEEITTIVNNHFQPDSEEPDINVHYKFSVKFVKNLFRPNDHPTIHVSGSLLDIDLRDLAYYQHKDIIIIASHGMPEGFESMPKRDELQFDCDDVSFELRSVVVFKADQNQYNPKSNNFSAISFMRHRHFEKWWKQERGDKVVTQCKKTP